MENYRWYIFYIHNPDGTVTDATDNARTLRVRMKSQFLVFGHAHAWSPNFLVASMTIRPCQYMYEQGDYYYNGSGSSGKVI